MNGNTGTKTGFVLALARQPDEEVEAERSRQLLAEEAALAMLALEVELDLEDALGPARRARPVEAPRVSPPAPHAEKAAHAAGEAQARRSRMRRSMSWARSWWATHQEGSSWARSSATDCTMGFPLP